MNHFALDEQEVGFATLSLSESVFESLNHLGHEHDSLFSHSRDRSSIQWILSVMAKIGWLVNR